MKLSSFERKSCREGRKRQAYLEHVLDFASSVLLALAFVQRDIGEKLVLFASHEKGIPLYC